MGHRAKMTLAARRLRQNLSVDIGVTGPLQWGTVASIASGTPSTVGVYLDSAAGQPGATITTGIPFLIGYVPTVGDVVLIMRQSGAARTQRLVLGSLETALNGINAAGEGFFSEISMAAVSIAKILLGSSGGGFRDSGDTVDALKFDSNQLATMRNALQIPPSAGGTVASTSYGSVPVKIAETTSLTGVASVTFSSIPGGFRHLRLYVKTWLVTGLQECFVRYNGDSGANYAQMFGWWNTNGSAVQPGIMRTGATALFIGYLGAVIHNHAVATIMNYADTGASKNIISEWYQASSVAAVGTGNQNIGVAGGWWSSTAAITSILVGAASNFNGGILTLEGVP